MPTLDWLHRTAAFTVVNQVPYRLMATVSHHGSSGSNPGHSADDLLIHGGNLEALKALMPIYRGLWAQASGGRAMLFGRLAKQQDGQSAQQQINAVLA